MHATSNPNRRITGATCELVDVVVDGCDAGIRLTEAIERTPERPAGLSPRLDAKIVRDAGFACESQQALVRRPQLGLLDER